MEPGHVHGKPWRTNAQGSHQKFVSSPQSGGGFKTLSMRCPCYVEARAACAYHSILGHPMQDASQLQPFLMATSPHIIMHPNLQLARSPVPQFMSNYQGPPVPLTTGHPIPKSHTSPFFEKIPDHCTNVPAVYDLLPHATKVSPTPTHPIPPDSISPVTMPLLASTEVQEDAVHRGLANLVAESITSVNNEVALHLGRQQRKPP